MSLKHSHEQPSPPKRTLVLGAGFVGSAAARHLSAAGATVEALTSKALDLLAPDAERQLDGLLDADTALVLVSARAPVRDQAMLLDNLKMLEPVAAVIRRRPPAHLVYVSSDAVYRDIEAPLTETSCAEPASLHGVMHLAREVILKDAIGDTPFAIVRPSLLYGPDDPHNGYGPNRFRRLAAAGEPVQLFGQGEERRDHVFIEDVGALIARIVLHGSSGVLNIATGTVTSFRDIAEKVIALTDRDVQIETLPRSGPMPHNGYRPFDPGATLAAFPDFSYTAIDEGLQLCANARD